MSLKNDGRCFLFHSKAVLLSRVSFFYIFFMPTFLSYTVLLELMKIMNSKVLGVKVCLLHKLEIYNFGYGGVDRRSNIETVK